MRENLQALNELGLAETPIFLGGAALTRTYVERDLRELYEGRLFYGKDAFEGLHTLDTLMDGKRAGALDPDFGRAAGGRDLPPRKSERDPGPAVVVPARSDVAEDATVFTPPFLGSRVAKGVSLDEIVHYLNETALFRNQWQFRPDKSRQETDPEFKERLRHTLAEELAKAKAGGWLVPAVVWGYYPVNGEPASRW
jgi:5-methyltetrahydrofolate--homocysteine methyltransferase